MRHAPLAARSLTRARSASLIPTARRRDAVIANGADGWLSTGASMVSSTIMPSANPPVKHMPTAPTPGPPHSAWASAASRRSHPITGLVRSSANAVNSRATHTRTRESIVYDALTDRPGVPNSEGIRTLNPASTTRWANATTPGCRPGTSWITMTAGPVPPAYTERVRPSWVNEDSVNPARSFDTVCDTTPPSQPHDPPNPTKGAR